MPRSSVRPAPIRAAGPPGAAEEAQHEWSRRIRWGVRSTIPAHTSHQMHGRHTPTDPKIRSHHEIRTRWDWRVVTAGVAIVGALGVAVVATADQRSSADPGTIAA